jgi:hypothetical protein
VAFPNAVLARQLGRFEAELAMPDLEPFFLDAVYRR